MRLSGLASGLDIDSMVTELMKAKRASYDKMVQKRTSLEWTREDYRSLSTKIVDFRNNKINSYNLSNAIQAKKSEVTGDTNALIVNSVSSSAAGVLNVEVSTVAKAANKVFTYSGSLGVDDLSTATLEDLGFTEDVNNPSQVMLTIDSIKLTVSKDLTLSGLASAINSNSSIKATALFSGTSFSITSSQTGKNTDLVSGWPTDVDDNFEVSSSSDGQDAIVKINGIEFTQASNTFSINGFSFTVKAQSVTSGSTNIQAVSDTSKILETIKSFVSEYNSLISSINSELSEVKYYSYSALTDDQKKEMSDDEIELWQSKARSGNLRNDTTLSKYVSELRMSVLSLIGGIDTGAVDSEGNAVKMSIGITTGSYSESGKLYLDEDKLIKALETDSDKVTALFTMRSSDTSPGSKTSGVFAKIMSSSMEALTLLAKKAGTSITSTEETAAFLESSLLGDQLRNMKRRETDMLDRLDAMEKYYYKVFSAMETAISNYNTQSSSIISLISG